MTDISPEAVKAFVSANADVTDPVQRRLLDMLTALSAKCESLEQERAVIWRQRRDVQGTNDVLQAANYTLLTERDTIKATVARLCEALRQIPRIIDNGAMTNDDGTERTARRYREQIWPMINQAIDEALAASKETLP